MRAYHSGILSQSEHDQAAVRLQARCLAACAAAYAWGPNVANPDYRAYTVIKREGKDDYWLNLGVAFRHEDGEGFNLLLQAMPLDGKLVLRTYKEKPEEQEKVIKGKFKK